MERTIATEPVSRRRALAFRIVGTLVAVAGLALSIVFVIPSFTDDEQAIHRMHNVGGLISFGLAISVPLILAVWRPREHIVAFRVAGAASLAGAVAGVMSGDLLTGGWLVGFALFVIVWALHPARATVLRASRPRLGPAAVAALGLVPGIAYTLTQARLQRDGVAGDPHAEFHHYSGMAAAGLAFPVGALVASIDGAGRRVAAWIVGGSTMLFGLASIAFEGYAGAFDAAWSWITVAAGAAFVALSEIAEREDVPA